MKPKSDNLFHFTRNIDNLKSILLNGFMPRYCREDVEWYMGSCPKRFKFMAYPIVCFCDIPISRILKHTASFGEYGLGMSKKWGISKGLTPVIYVTKKSAVPRVTNYLARNITYNETDKELEEKANVLWHLIALTKPITGKVKKDNGIFDVDFYQENEWRYVPSEKWPILFDNEFGEKKDASNIKLECQKITFIAKEVEYIFVKNNQEILEMFDFIHEKLHMSKDNKKILSTKIISLETLRRDI